MLTSPALVTLNIVEPDVEVTRNGLIPADPATVKVPETARLFLMVLVPVVEVALMVPNVPIVAARKFPVDSVVVAPEFEK